MKRLAAGIGRDGVRIDSKLFQSGKEFGPSRASTWANPKRFRAECFQDHGDVRGFAAGKSLHSLSAMNFSGNKRREGYALVDGRIWADAEKHDEVA